MRSGILEHGNILHGERDLRQAYRRLAHHGTAMQALEEEVSSRAPAALTRKSIISFEYSLKEERGDFLSRLSCAAKNRIRYGLAQTCGKVVRMRSRGIWRPRGSDVFLLKRIRYVLMRTRYRL